MRFRWRNVQFVHDAPHRLADSQDVIVRHLALNRRRIVGVSPEWRRRTRIRHDVLRLRKQFVDVLKRSTHMPLMVLAKAVGAGLFVHFLAGASAVALIAISIS